MVVSVTKVELKTTHYSKLTNGNHFAYVDSARIVRVQITGHVFRLPPGYKLKKGTRALIQVNNNQYHLIW